MGRSVNCHSRALFVIYLVYQTGEEEPDTIQDADDWKWYKEDIIERLQTVCPSLYPDSTGAWDEREVYQIARNGLCAVFLSEYCGLVSLSFVPLFEVCYSYDQEAGLQVGWLAKMEHKLKAVFPERFWKVATFSNGNSVYEKVQS